ncbi:MAG: phosphomethylpyrimidine synthase ThiC [Deltaproteobacteria bacterium]|nr:phosphomethylpyrimidine synthase ThiC [Deltaproteobacteria bacterium]MBW1794868.1 phosphomethylpyrimidine synthase ThiC [Deltaproteobacteria bacterium]MBW2329527.1 phosphomethylpyrimidine synthase ThiC [Deltaproteobacteria bacterium]
MTQLESARTGVITEAMHRVAQTEAIDPEALCARVADGTVVIPLNKKHNSIQPVGIGKGLSVKVNANIGTSGDQVDLMEELEKLQAAIEAKADTIMDLSTGGDITKVRQAIIKSSSIPVGTVPIYQAVVEAVKSHGGIIHLTPDLIFKAVEAHALDGVDFMTIHAGVTLNALERLRSQGRTTDIVSRGGAFLATWMIYHKRENPFFEDFDRLLSIAREYDITLSLGDGLRPGSLADATDRAQIHELLTLGELAQKAWDAGVQVMIEGPGHIPLDQVEAQVILQKQLCRGAPFYVLGPLVTDIAAGYDHIACAIGGAVAGMAGADFLCYVTPAEHLKLPSRDDVREGVMATRIAAHAADIARGHKGAIERDLEMSKARKKLDWNRQISLSIDPAKARAYRSSSKPSSNDVCTMCGKFCAIKIIQDYFRS